MFTKALLWTNIMLAVVVKSEDFFKNWNNDHSKQSIFFIIYITNEAWDLRIVHTQTGNHSLIYRNIQKKFFCLKASIFRI